LETFKDGEKVESSEEDFAEQDNLFKHNMSRRGNLMERDWA